jgi:hypothetical protein
MKINIKKLGAGAGLVYEPLPSIPSQGRPPEAPEGEIDDSALKGIKGLTSDVTAYGAKYNAALNQYNSLPPQVRSSVQGKMLRNQLKGDRFELLAIANSKEQMDKIVDNKKDAMSEFAVFQGHVVAQDQETGDIVNLTLPEYSQSLSSEAPKYKALTNGELINLRSSDPRFAGRDNVLPILNNAISTEAVVKNIRGALQNLGSFSKGTADASYEEKRIEEGANAALNQGLSYVKTSSGDFSQSNAENLKMAGNAMWGMLDDASKDLLRMKAINYKVYKPEQIEGAAMGLALAMLKPAIQEKNTEKSGEALGKSPGAKTTSGGKPVDLDYWGAVGIGKGAPEQVVLLNGDNNKVTMQGKTFAPFMKTKDTFYGTTTLDKIDKLGAIADMNSVYFGDKKLGSELFDSVVYDNGKPAVVWMPFKEETDGSIKPDLNRNQDMEDIRKQIKDQGITDPNIKMEMYRAKDFNNFDNTGEPSETVELMPFVTFSGFSNTNAIKETSKWFEPKEARYDWYEKQFQDAKGKNNSSYFDTWADPDVLQGMIYVPLRVGAGVFGQYASGSTPDVDPSYKAIGTYEGNNLGQLGGGRTYRQLDPNINLDKNALQ